MLPPVSNHISVGVLRPAPSRRVDRVPSCSPIDRPATTVAVPPVARAQPGVWVHGVVVLHPSVDQSKSASGIGDRIHADLVTLEGFDEGLGHAVALGAFDPA
jgi:hypothetical protein